MCGIAGVVAPRGGEAEEAVVRGLADALRHRGPDRTSTWIDPDRRCAFGHTRLSVIDLETGDQPMSTPEGAYTLVFNGEIYNFRALRRELEGRGVRFRTRSDTEVLLLGWAEWGETLLPRLEGMFAFAVWEAHRRRLVLARDRAGQKPLHILRAPGGVAFASEPAAFRGAAPRLGGSLEVDPAALGAYLALGHVPAPRTVWREVRVLPPAHLVEITEAGVGESRRWWRFEPEPHSVGAEEAAARVRTLLEQAVQRRTVADVPLGALLSGGVDSTAVTALLQRTSDHPVRTFSIGFHDPVYDEGAWARRAAEHIGTVHTHRRVSAPEPGVIDEIAGTWGVPFADSSAIPLRLVSRMAREEVTVALTGDAGDELFAGYWRMHAVGMADRVPDGIAGPAARLVRLLPGGSFRSPARRAERLLDAAALPAHRRLAEWAGVFGGRAFALLRDDVRAGVDDGIWLEAFETAWGADPGADTLTRAVRATFDTYLPEDLLVKADRGSMASGLELRSPFLDTDLVEYCATIPPGLQRRGGRLKAVLKDAVADLVPADVLDRPKQGFGVPLPGWFRGPWRGVVTERLHDPDGPLGAWLDLAAVRAVVDDHLERGVDREHEVWALLVLDAWVRGGVA